jgi:hypothetical protein
MSNLQKRNHFYLAFVPFLMTTLLTCAPPESARADTTATIWFTNSGPAINPLKVTDDVCGQTRVNQFFAANDGKKVEGFCVREASQVKTDLSIFRDNDPNPKYQLQDVPTDSSVDVFTGQVTPH